VLWSVLAAIISLASCFLHAVALVGNLGHCMCTKCPSGCAYAVLSGCAYAVVKPPLSDLCDHRDLVRWQTEKYAGSISLPEHAHSSRVYNSDRSSLVLQVTIASLADVLAEILRSRVLHGSSGREREREREGERERGRSEIGREGLVLSVVLVCCSTL